MSQLLETIKCKDGILFDMDFHQARFEKSQKEYFGISPKIQLSKATEIPDFAKQGLYRCRIVFSEQIDKIEFLPHQYRKITSLKLVENNEIDYRYKFANREKLNELFEKRGICDDIIIIKNGLVSDSFVTNLIFFDGEKWWTPDSPLLSGTQRARLLNEGKIFETQISINEIRKYKKVGLINALNDLEEMQVVSIENIHF